MLDGRCMDRNARIDEDEGKDEDEDEKKKDQDVKMKRMAGVIERRGGRMGMSFLLLLLFRWL